MTRTLPTLLAVALLAPLAAHADAPAFVPVQGFLTDADGAAVDTDVTLDLVLYDDAAAGSEVFREQQTVLVESGHFTVYLGQVVTLDLATFRDNGALWLGVTVDGGTELAPRLPLGTTPFAGFAQYAGAAATAGDAATVGGLGPGDLRTVGDTVDWADLANVPADLADGDADTDTFAGLSCADGEVLKWDAASTSFVCAADDDTQSSYTAGTGIDITTGVISNTGDANAADDLVTSTNFGGDVSGTYDNLQLGNNVVQNVHIAADSIGTAELVAGAVGNFDIAANVEYASVQDATGTEQFTLIHSNKGLRFAGAGATSASFDPATHTVTFSSVDSDTLYTAGPGIDVTSGVITNTGDTDATDDVTTTTSFAGDVTGTYANLQLTPGSVTATEIGNSSVRVNHIADSAVGPLQILDQGVGNADIADSVRFVRVQNQFGATQFDVTRGNSQLRLEGGGATTVSFSGVDQRVVISSTDDDLLGNQTCGLGQVMKYSASGWVCDFDANAGGDVTEVLAGAGLTGGGDTGSVTLDVDFAAFGSCTGGDKMVGFDASGNIVCAGDLDSGGDITAVNTGAGLTGGNTTGAVTLNVDETYLQRRVGPGCAPGSYIQAVNVDGSVVCQPDSTSAATPVQVPMGNDITMVDINGSSNDTSITIGADGFPVISYYTTVGQALWVAKCNDVRCVGGDETISLIDNVNDRGRYNSIAIGADGLPVIAYHDNTDQNLLVAKCDDPACSGGNETINSLAISDAPGPMHIAIGLDGLPVISFYRSSFGGSVWVLWCVEATCDPGVGVWVTRVDQGVGGAGLDNAIAVGLDGLPVVAYRDSGVGLKLAKCVDAGCTNPATITAVDTTNFLVGLDVSVNIGADGLPIIAYYDGGPQTLKVAKCGDATCSTATLTTVDDGGVANDVVGRANSISIPPDGLPVISYYDSTNQSLKVAKCNDAACAGANEIITTVDVPSGGRVGQGSSITTGIDGNPVISYNEAWFTELMVAHCANPYCVPNWTRR